MNTPAAVVSLCAFACPATAQLQWHDTSDLTLAGKGWSDTKAPFDRLPAKAASTVRKPVWKLSRHSAGMSIRFKTDATEIHVRWSLTNKSLAMPHMPATGVSGVDLYVKFKKRWRWLSVGKPTKFPDNQVRLVKGISKEHRDYVLYLPLYNGVKKLAIGVPEGCAISKGTPPGHRKPIVFYGTSITHGGCASRPGMVHTAILGRNLDHPTINLGFSGNGTMDPSVADLLAELDAAVFIIDCLPNMRSAPVTARVAPLVHTLRKAHPHTPILLVEDRTYSNAFLLANAARRNRESRAALRSAFETLEQNGVKHLHYLEGDALLGDDGEGTVDGSHPTDLGFYRQAQAFERKLRGILGRK